MVVRRLNSSGYKLLLYSRMVLPLHVHIDLSGTEKCSICYSLKKTAQRIEFLASISSPHDTHRLPLCSTPQALSDFLLEKRCAETLLTSAPQHYCETTLNPQRQWPF